MFPTRLGSCHKWHVFQWHIERGGSKAQLKKMQTVHGLQGLVKKVSLNICVMLFCQTMQQGFLTSAERRRGNVAERYQRQPGPWCFAPLCVPQTQDVEGDEGPDSSMPLVTCSHLHLCKVGIITGAGTAFPPTFSWGLEQKCL